MLQASCLIIFPLSISRPELACAGPQLSTSENALDHCDLEDEEEEEESFSG